MSHLEVTAHLKIRAGQLDGFKTQVHQLRGFAASRRTRSYFH